MLIKANALVDKTSGAGRRAATSSVISRLMLVTRATPALLALLSSACAAYPLNPDVTPATIHKTICVRGYSDTVRPSTSYTNPVKFRLMRQAGLQVSDKADWALDHRIPIALGGHPRSLENLRLLTKHDNSRKSRIEVKLLCYVCTGQMSLGQAQQEIWLDWEVAYKAHARDKCSR